MWLVKGPKISTHRVDSRQLLMHVVLGASDGEGGGKNGVEGYDRIGARALFSGLA